ncbi:MAG: hypothetical protein QXD04_05290, partial [Candidatus Bathyarchaeia archaeon]
MKSKNQGQERLNLRMSRRPRRVTKEKRGQFVVAAALLISILTLSIALSVHQLSLNRLQLRYEAVEELAMGLSSDLDRCLTYALHSATELYYEKYRNLTNLEGLPPEEAKLKAYNEAYNEVQTFISKWISSVIKSYSTLGLGITLKYNQTNSIDLQIIWGNLNGFSSISSYFYLDIESYGFKGWVCHSGKYVALNLTDQMWFSESMNSTSLIFNITQGKDEDSPIPNLTKELVNVWVNLNRNKTLEATVLDLKYLGRGSYNITFSPPMNNNTKGLYLLVKTPQDHIYVAASIPYQDITVTLRSQEISSPRPTDRGLIKLGDADPYPLPQDLNGTNIDVGEYGLSYIPENENYGFYNWTTTGYVIVENPHEKDTKVIIIGNGTITAFYIPYMTVDFNSSEDDGSTVNLGWIVFNGNYLRNQTGDPGLPSSAKVAAGSYGVSYIPASGYAFINWTCSGQVSVENPYSRETRINVQGDGSITAYYRAFRIYLSSRDLNQTSDYLGSITLAGKNYSLPNDLKIVDIFTPFTPGDYEVIYNPYNSSYKFFCWESTGGVTPRN